MPKLPASPPEHYQVTSVFRYFLLLFFASFALLGVILFPFVHIFIFSFLFAGIFRPLFTRLSRYCGPHTAALTTCLVITLGIFLPGIFLLGALSREAYDLLLLVREVNIDAKVQELLAGNQYVIQVKAILAEMGVRFEPKAFVAQLSDLVKNAGLLLHAASTWAANILKFLFSFMLMIVIIYFLLLDHERLMAFVLRLSPLPDELERQLLQRFEKIGSAVLVGNGLTGIIQGAFGALLFYVLGLDSPILWGAIMALLVFLPILGIGAVLFPAAIWLFLSDATGSALLLLAYYLLVMVLLEYGLKPKVVGRQVGMHILLVFLSILGGMSIFGVLGILYGPLIATTFLSLAEVYQEKYSDFVRGKRQNNGRGERI